MASRVLVVDDDDDVRSLIALQLSLAGFDPAEAATVDAGLAMMAQTSPDLVLTDLNFGTDSGERIVARCRATGQSVILMSASVDTARTTSGEGDGVIFLRKPFTMDELMEAVSEAIRS